MNANQIPFPQSNYYGYVDSGGGGNGNILGMLQQLISARMGNQTQPQAGNDRYFGVNKLQVPYDQNTPIFTNALGVSSLGGRI